MLSLAAFKERYQWAATLTDGEVQAALDEAEAEIGPGWGEEENRGHGLVAADALARSPHGAQALLMQKDGSTIYTAEVERLRTKIGGANRLVLD